MFNGWAVIALILLRSAWGHVTQYTTDTREQFIIAFYNH
jgi:hypothetical protein